MVQGHFRQKVRKGVAFCANVPLVSSVGTSYYWWCARHIADSLLLVRGVKRVGIRGGMIRECRPGISDIDFTILMEESLPDEALLDLGVKIRRLRQRYPVFGECIVSDVLSWEAFMASGSGPCHWYRDHWWRNGHQWQPEQTKIEVPLSQRFSLGFYHLRKSLSEFILWRRTRSQFFRERLSTQLFKGINACRTNPLDWGEVRGGDSQNLLVQLVEDLDSLCIRWFTQVSKQKHSWQWNGLSLGTQPSVEWVEREAATVAELQGSVSHKIQLTPIPMHLLLEGGTQDLYQLIHSIYQQEVTLSPSLAFFTPNFFEASKLSWGGWFTENSAIEYSLAAGSFALAESTHWAVREAMRYRLCSDVVHLTQQRLFEDSSLLTRFFRRSAAEALMVRSGCLVGLTELVKLGTVRSFPMCQRVLSDSHPSLGSGFEFGKFLFEIKRVAFQLS